MPKPELIVSKTVFFYEDQRNNGVVAFPSLPTLYDQTLTLNVPDMEEGTFFQANVYRCDDKFTARLMIGEFEKTDDESTVRCGTMYQRETTSVTRVKSLYEVFHQPEEMLAGDAATTTKRIPDFIHGETLHAVEREFEVEAPGATSVKIKIK
jgi:hypothetical protein